jgi:hypothetical protein
MKKINIKLAIVLALALAVSSACDADLGVGPFGEERGVNYTLYPHENVKLTWASFNYSEATSAFTVWFTGNVLVRDLAYAKVVAIRYTTDGWKTWKECQAAYSFKNGTQETWSFKTGNFTFKRANPGVSLTEAVRINFDFVVRYAVAGQTWWDNNGGANFHLDQNVRYFSR